MYFQTFLFYNVWSGAPGGREPAAEVERTLFQMRQPNDVKLVEVKLPVDGPSPLCWVIVNDLVVGIAFHSKDGWYLKTRFIDDVVYGGPYPTIEEAQAAAQSWWA